MAPADFQYQVQEILNRCFDDVNNRLNVFPQVRDDESLALGADSDVVLRMRSTSLAANTGLTGVLVGTPVTPVAIAANSLLVSDVTASGDILLAVQVGGNSRMGLMLDGSSGDTLVGVGSGGSFDVYVAGTKVLDYASGAFAFQQATTISTTVTTLTLSPTTDVHIPDAKGLVIGHTAQVTVGNALTELEVLGTESGIDMAILIGGWSATASISPSIKFLRSKNAAIGSFTTVAAEDILAVISIRGDDGGDYETTGAQLRWEAEGTIAASRIPTRFLILLAPGGVDDALTERLRVTSGGVISTLAAAPVNVTAAGAGILGGGVAFSDVANAHIDDATHGTGTVVHYIGNNTINTSAPSDERLKDVLGPTALLVSPLLSQIELVDYRWKRDGQDLHFGWVAQQVYSVLPELVHVPENGDPWHVKGHQLVPYLLKGWQEHESRFSTVEERLAAVEEANRILRGQLVALGTQPEVW